MSRSNGSKWGSADAYKFVEVDKTVFAHKIQNGEWLRLRLPLFNTMGARVDGEFSTELTAETAKKYWDQVENFTFHFRITPSFTNTDSLYRLVVGSALY